MKIAIIGTGNIGGALATSWAKKGHDIILCVRDKQNFKGQDLLNNPNTTVADFEQGIAAAEVILVATPIAAVVNVAKSLGNVANKVIIDATNAVFAKPEGFNNGFEAILGLSNATKVVKCFNSTGFENMKNPQYGDTTIDMFMAGNSAEAKAIVETLAKDAGFGQCIDFGGNDKVALLEQFALCWINLAMMQKKGRDFAFTIIER
jgi:8-hydroxy-5-deazaflavin:NADPH oxidoreductase